jgi:predicted nuclease of predicted toxin-antitoxin system
MNLSPAWSAKLQAAGLEAVHWSSIGAADAADGVLFEWAAANGAVILTHDLGFAAIHAHLRTKGPSV